MEKRLFIAMTLLMCVTTMVFASGAQGTAGSEGPVKLTWVHSGFNNEDKVTFGNEVIAMYLEDHPGVEIELSTMSSDNYQTWLQTQLVGGTAPDIFSVFTSWGKEYVRDGTAHDLVPFLEQENRYNPGGKWVDKISPSLMVQLLDPTNGKIGSVPMAVGVNKIMYNKQIFKKFGIEKEPETYAELIEIAKKFKAQDLATFVYTQKGGVLLGGHFHWVQRIFMDALTWHLMDDLDLNQSYFIDINEIAGGLDQGIIDVSKSPWKDIYPLIKEPYKGQNYQGHLLYDNQGV